MVRGTLEKTDPFGHDYNNRFENIEMCKKGSILNNEIALQFASVFSTASVRINLPQHIFFHLSFHNFKPNPLNYNSSLNLILTIDGVSNQSYRNCLLDIVNNSCTKKLLYLFQNSPMILINCQNL